MNLAAHREEDADADALDAVFFALSDPVRRRILERLDGQALLVSELAKPFRISLQAVSRHIQVLVRAGLVMQERTGRISRCRLDAGPIYQAAVWLDEIDRERSPRAKKNKSSKSSRVVGGKSKT